MAAPNDNRAFYPDLASKKAADERRRQAENDPRYAEGEEASDARYGQAQVEGQSAEASYYARAAAQEAANEEYFYRERQLEEEEEIDFENETALQSMRRGARTQLAARSDASFGKYLPALSIAILKDLLDFALLGSFPGIGFVVTSVFSVLIFILLTFAGGLRAAVMLSRTSKRAGALLAATAVEGLFFGLNFLPIQTLSVFLIYRMEKRASERS